MQFLWGITAGSSNHMKIHWYFNAELGTEDKLIADTGDCTV